MNKITTMDKAAAKALHSAADEALRKVATEFGLQYVPKNGKYEPSSGEFTMRGAFKLTERADGRAQEQVDFERYCALYGVAPTDYKKQGVVAGKTLELVGFNLKRQKYPIMMRDTATGKIWLHTTTTLRLLGIETGEGFFHNMARG